MIKYDFLIVGAGLFGSTFANLATRNGYSCLVIDKRNHIGGNCYTENVKGIDVHKYGPHIFHTNDKNIWEYVNEFASFNNYKHKVKANYHNKIFSFPINLFTLNQLYRVTTPESAKAHIEKIRIKNDNPSNLEEWILDKVGREIYETFVEGYTHKQWNKHPRELPASIIKRIPIRFTFDDNYFNDEYQGIPKEGYTKLIENMLDETELHLEVDYLTNREKLDKMAKYVVYTGPIDEFFNYEFGEMEWRSLRFERLIYKDYDFQGTSIVNFTSKKVPYTRIVEYKHFSENKVNDTVVVQEYPDDYEKGKEKFYPINTVKNEEKLNKYKKLIDKNKYIFGGRLAEYKYYDMHQVIASSIHKYRSLVLPIGERNESLR
jgi:UDP-galactopyranose mutase